MKSIACQLGLLGCNLGAEGFAGVGAAIFDDCYHIAYEFLQIQFEHCYR